MGSFVTAEPQAELLHRLHTVRNIGLTSMGGTGKLVLGFISGGMMVTDAGGSFNRTVQVGKKNMQNGGYKNERI